MPEIVGTFRNIFTSMAPVDAHVAHLRHLSSSEAAAQLLIEKFGCSAQMSRDLGKVLSAHVGQALEFHEVSLRAPRTIRPMLQYYCYLNLAVAVVVAYRPINFQQYRQHGVEDRTHSLTKLNISSVLVRARRGAIPLFHSILSGDPIERREFRLNELIGSIPLVQYEVADLFMVPVQSVAVQEGVVKDDKSGCFYSRVELLCKGPDDSPASLTKERVEKAMPDLAKSFVLEQRERHSIVYRSKGIWKNEDDALDRHRKTCLRLINYGGNLLLPVIGQSSLEYVWRAVARKALFPTLSATLLLSFSLASICRYRPSLSRSIERSKLNLLLDIFVGESNGIVIPAMRNLLFREELVISSIGV